MPVGIHTCIQPMSTYIYIYVHISICLYIFQLNGVHVSSAAGGSLRHAWAAGDAWHAWCAGRPGISVGDAYVCIRICMHIYVHTHKHVYIYRFIYTHVDEYTDVYANRCVYANIHACVPLPTTTSLARNLYLSIHLPSYVAIHTHVFTLATHMSVSPSEICGCHF